MIAAIYPDEPMTWRGWGEVRKRQPRSSGAVAPRVAGPDPLASCKVRAAKLA